MSGLWYSYNIERKTRHALRNLVFFSLKNDNSILMPSYSTRDRRKTSRKKKEWNTCAPFSKYEKINGPFTREKTNEKSKKRIFSVDLIF